MINKKVSNKCSIHSCFFKNTKGELTTQQIIGLIILITSFVVILVLFMRLNLGETSNSQVCHNSVVLRGKSLLKTEPLDCKISYFCVSGGGNCVEGNYDSKVEIRQEQNEVFKVLAEELSDCWWMFGEGKVNYLGREISGKNHCAVCSRISFDEKLKETFPTGISIEDFKNFLITTNVSNGEESYAKYLYDVNDFSLLTDKGWLLKEIDFKKDYLVFTGIGLGGNNILARFMAPDDISGANVCDVFDLTKA